MKKNITALDILDDNKPITVGWTKYSGYLFLCEYGFNPKFHIGKGWSLDPLN